MPPRPRGRRARSGGRHTQASQLKEHTLYLSPIGNSQTVADRVSADLPSPTRVLEWAISVGEEKVSTRIEFFSGQLKP
jgi:hypothetical protein